MYKTKLIASILLIAAVLFAQVGVAAAAAPAQDTTISGTIVSIVPEKDANGVVTVLVTYKDAQGVDQTVRISQETAASLGLLTLDPATNLPVVDPNTGLPVVDGTKVDTTVTIDPTTVIPDEPTEEEPVHPISDLLASFFGADAQVVDGYHQDGFGFGVIAQALWMSQNLNGDATTAGLILEAKKTGDYSAFTLPDGSTPTNWGQFKKAVNDKKNNLGIIVSGKADNDTTDTTDPSAQKDHGNGKDKNKDKGNGNGNNGHGKP
ncbi:MAG: hypothetical protein QM730_13110 [Anaerolineales bacterium]